MKTLFLLNKMFGKWNKNKHRLTFDEETHTYFWDGVALEKSVTKYLNNSTDYSDVDPTILKMAATRGTIVHKYIEDYYTLGKKDPNIEGQYIGYCDAFHAYEEKYDDIKMKYCELKIYSPKLNIAGTIDGVFKKGNQWGIIDYKTTYKLNEESVKEQLEVYQSILAEWGIKVELKLALHLGKQGDYKLYVL